MTEKIKSIKPYTLGVMQGRLLPKYLGRYQAHPLGYWQDEFPLAQKLGLDCIEFILDYNDYDQNPLLSERGLAEIRNLARETGVGVETICADFFMQCPMHDKDVGKAKLAGEVMNVLLDNAHVAGISCVVIPCVDESSIQASEAQKKFVEVFTPHCKRAEQLKVKLALETDLPAQPFKKLVDALASDAVKVNYDIGNSASLGYDYTQEFAAYGDVICDVHIKDRTLGGGSIVLGKGHAKIEAVLESLYRSGFNGPYIMQAFRDDEGLPIFKEQLQYSRNLLDRIYKS